MSVYHRDGNDPDVPITAHRITNPWNEASVTWEKRDSLQNWDTPGGDFDPSAVATTLVGPTDKIRYEWGLTDLVQGWLSGKYQNYGVALRTVAAGIFGERFDTSDHADPSHRPRLTITYSCNCGQVCVAPTGSGKIAMVGNWIGLSPNPLDLAREAILESWGYTVDIYDDNLLWLLNASNYDAIYIAATASDGTLVDQLKYETIGIVSELGEQNNDLGFASGAAVSIGTDINIQDAGHDITRPFAAGPLRIKTAASRLTVISGAAAPDAQVLADAAGAGSLVALESGAALGGYGLGEYAAARRVMLPLGLTGGDDWRHINNNGRLIVQRAIEWAMNKQPGAPVGSSLWLSTLDDVSGSGAPGLAAWTDGEVIAFADPNLVFEPGTTNGTFFSALNLDDFGNGADIDALHYVGGNITVGGEHSVDLLTGDLLLSTADNETLTSLNSLAVNDEDVFVFRPYAAGDYSAGTFIFLIDGSRIHGESDTVGISLVEKATLVGDRTLAKGTFIIAITNRRDVIEFTAEEVGLDTSSGDADEFIDGPSLNFGSEIRGLELAEDEITLGGHTIPAGSILITLNDDGASVADNGLSVNSEDVFYLTLTQAGSSPVADATLLFDGSDVNLDTSQEHLQALTLTSEVIG